MVQKVAASITVYYPDRERLRENIRAVLPQASYLILIVNGKESFQEVRELIREFTVDSGKEAAGQAGKIRVRVNDKNLGVAHALNQAMLEGEKLGAEWVLTLDQDSVVTGDFIEKLMVHARKERVGIICPRVTDRNRREDTEKSVNSWNYVLTCITSGSLTNVEIWRKIGGFNDRLFIDYVDHEYCARLIQEGYAIIQDNGAELLHELGKQQYRSFLGLGPYPVLNHSAMRRYYLFRNINYFCYKYPTLWRTAVDRKRFLAGTALTVAFFENHKIEKLAAMARGWLDYKKMVREEKSSGQETAP